METLEQTLRRLDQERDDADERYNTALTALDRAMPKPGEWPSPLLAADDSALAAINDAWAIAAVAPAPRPGWRGRLTGFIWRTVAPYLQRQTSFNSLIADHLNRHAAAARPDVPHGIDRICWPAGGTRRDRDRAAGLAHRAWYLH